jgi:predicted ArsR family transcriptional regulator
VDLGSQATGVAALADPTRRALYEYVVSRPEPVGREEAAGALELAAHTANFHLDRLVDAGLLTTEFRRLTGRTGPGAGRPAKLYRRADRQWSVSLPDRHYDLVGDILASGIERARASGSTLEVAIDEAASDTGRAIGSAAAPGDLETFADVLAGQGFEPRLDDDDTVLLANCPFDALAKTHTELVCGLNRSFVQGVADGLGCAGVTAHLEPEPGQCCVKARRAG